MPRRLLFSRDAREGCNGTMTARAERATIAANVMYKELHPNHCLTEIIRVENLRRSNVGSNGGFIALCCSRLRFALDIATIVRQWNCDQDRMGGTFSPNALLRSKL